MADTAAYLPDSVLPEVPYRQWVITVPFRVRYLIAFDKELCADVKRIAVRTVMSHLRLKARRKGIRKGHGGAVVFLQRFGGSVNLNPHLHLLAVDGVYTAGPAGGCATFHPLPAPTTLEVGKLTARIRARVLRRLEVKGLFLDREEIDVLRCLNCGSRRKLIAQITEAPVIRAFLACLGLPPDPPELKPALWPP